jgi:hypothetical protein
MTLVALYPEQSSTDAAAAVTANAMKKLSVFEAIQTFEWQKSELRRSLLFVVSSAFCAAALGFYAWKAGNERAAARAAGPE